MAESLTPWGRALKPSIPLPHTHAPWRHPCRYIGSLILAFSAYFVFRHIYGLQQPKWLHVLCCRHSAVGTSEERQTEGTMIWVRYGSHGGLSERQARILGSVLQRQGDRVAVGKLNDFNPRRLQPGDILLVVTSTHHHSPPRNASAFGRWLDAQADKLPLDRIGFAVFSNGSTAYPTPFAFGRKVARRLRELGGRQIVPEFESDAALADSREDDFYLWVDEILGTCGSWHVSSSGEWVTRGHRRTRASFQQAVTAVDRINGFQLTMLSRHRTSVVGHFPDGMPQANAASASALSLTGLEEGTDRVAAAHARPGAVLASVRATKLLWQSHTKRVFELEVELPPGMTYSAGSDLLVNPRNPTDDVASVLQSLALPPDDVFSVTGSDSFPTPQLHLGNEAGEKEGARGHSLCTWRIALTHYFDISTVSPSLLGLLATMASDPAERESLSAMAAEGYPEVVRRRACLSEILARHPSVSVNNQFSSEDAMGGILFNLSPLVARPYSVCSSPLDNPTTVTVIVSVPLPASRATTTVDAATTPYACGLTAPYLAALVAGDRICCSIVEPPVQHRTDPGFMIATGTGVSTIIGHVRHGAAERRLAARPRPWCNIRAPRNPTPEDQTRVIVGHRTASEAIHPEVLREGLLAGVLSEVTLCYSQEGGGRVTKALDDRGEAVFHSLMQGRPLCLAGGASATRAVLHHVEAAAVRHGGKSPGEARAWLQGLMETRQVVAELWESNGNAAVAHARFVRAIKLVLLEIRVSRGFLRGTELREGEAMMDRNAMRVSKKHLRRGTSEPPATWQARSKRFARESRTARQSLWNVPARTSLPAVGFSTFGNGERGAQVEMSKV